MAGPKTGKGKMTVGEAGRRGGEKVRRLIRDGEEAGKRAAARGRR